MKYKFIDLFCGIGGFHLALKYHASCVFASEWDKNAEKTYRMNFNVVNFAGDITKISPANIPDHDILCGGFPCQPFSVAGTQLGFNHKEQGNLFFNICDILKEKNPKVVFLENVKNIISHDGENTFKVILEELHKLEYYVKYKVLNATKYGNLPQNRERIYIVGFKDVNAFNKFKFPEEIPLTTKLFGDIIDIDSKQEQNLYQTNLSSPSVKKMLEGVTEKYHIYQYRRYMMRKNKSGECPTLTANMGSGGHNVPLILDNFGVRKLSVKECFKLQGYGDDYIIPNIATGHLYKQIGNSVPVTVVKRIADNIIEALNHEC